jgi:hypothetical protein
VEPIIIIIIIIIRNGFQRGRIVLQEIRLLNFITARVPMLGNGTLKSAVNDIVNVILA